MELRHVRYFVRAAELLHFTHAAQSLYISQPTLSTHIQQLEEELGLPLFDRIGRHVRLTEAGRILLEQSTRALRVLEDAREEIAELNGTLTGSLRIASLLLFGYEMLPTWITEFNCMHREVQILIRTGTAERIEGELLSGNVDLALTFVPPVSPDLIGEELFTEELIFAVSSNHRLAKEESITFEEACKVPLVLIGRASPGRQIFHRSCEARKIFPNIFIEIDDPTAIGQIVSSSTDVGTFLARRAFGNRTDLTIVPLSDITMNIHFGILRPAAERLSPPARAFFEYVLPH